MTWQRRVRWTAVALATPPMLVIALAAAIDAGFFRDALLRHIVHKTGRALTVDGPLHAHLLSLHPHISADGVILGNPPWMPSGVFARIGRLDFTLDLPGIHRSFGIARLEADALTLTLVRDEAGRANWQWSDPRVPHEVGAALVRSLDIPDARVSLKDAKQHLTFEGSASAREAPTKDGPPPLRIAGAGDLNGKPVTFEIDGEPLATSDHRRPYRFQFTEESSGSRLTGEGTLPHPFDFLVIDATFRVGGQDLRDLYFLTGLTLINTGPYQVSGRIERRDAQTRFIDLHATAGHSDISGHITIDHPQDRTTLDVDLDSRLMRLSDLGARAAGRAPPLSAPHLVLNDIPLNLPALRRDDTVAKIHVSRFEFDRIPVLDARATLTIDHGEIRLPLTGRLFDGTLDARIDIDARTDNPVDRLDLTLVDANLERYLTEKNEPLLEGLLRAHAKLHGHGRSLHEFSASATGTLTAVIPHGAIREALADAAGLDAHAIGLLFGKDKDQTPVRCGIASFSATDGVFATQRLELDTQPAVITGDGSIHMDDETLDLTLRAHPKHPTLRLRSPILLQGTLAHPTTTLQTRSAATQVGAALALGVLTPLASVLAFVDPGLAKDADCAELLAGGH